MKLLPLVACWCLPVLGAAQSVLDGTVTDAVGHAPLSAVHVYVPELHTGTTTDSIGNFALAIGARGTFTLQFTRLGYESHFARIDVAEVPMHLSIALRPGLMELKEADVVGLQVTAPRETSRSVTSMSTDEMRERGALSISDAVAKLPGVSQLTTGVGISKPVIRGLAGNRVQVNMLGQRFDNQQWQDEHGLGLSDLGIDRVQVIKGAAALQYGSDAIGGVLNVLEEKPAPVGTVQQNARLGLMGNTGGITAAYGIRASTKKYWWRLTAGADSHGDYASSGAERVLNSRFAMYNAKASIGWQKGRWASANHLQASFSQFGFVFDTLERTAVDARYSRSFDGPHHQVGFVVLGSENTLYGERTKWKINGGLTTNRRQEQEGGNKISLDMLLNTASLLTQATTHMGERGSWSNGVSLLYQTNTNFGNRIIIPDARTAEVGAFSYYHHRLERATLEAGVRLDERAIRTFSTLNLNPPTSPVAPFDRSWTAVNGSVGLAWDPVEELNVKANVSSGYRSGNLAELSSNGLHEGTSRYEVGDPDLKVEQNLCAELGLTWEWHEQVEVTATAFRNRFLDYIYLTPTGTEYIGFPVYQYLQQNALLQGGEAGLDIHPKALAHWDATFSYARVRGTTDDGGHLPFMPADRIRGELRFSTTKEHWVRAGFVQVLEQDRPAQFETRTPAYVLVNLSAGITLHCGALPLKTSLFCNNLADVQYVDHLSRFKTLGLYDMGRNVGLSLQLSF